MKHKAAVSSKGIFFISVGDPDPELDPVPQDLHVFEPPGSGSLTLDPSLSHKCVERTKIMPANNILHKILAKN
jgi:hypothetical protein